MGSHSAFPEAKGVSGMACWAAEAGRAQGVSSRRVGAAKGDWAGMERAGRPAKEGARRWAHTGPETEATKDKGEWLPGAPAPAPGVGGGGGPQPPEDTELEVPGPSGAEGLTEP